MPEGLGSSTLLSAHRVSFKMVLLAYRISLKMVSLAHRISLKMVLLGLPDANRTAQKLGQLALLHLSLIGMDSSFACLCFDSVKVIKHSVRPNLRVIVG